jgi:predicted transcriptional regulator
LVAKILRAAAKGTNETEIMNRCNLDEVAAENYLAALSELSFLNVEDDNEIYCQTTKKGLQFLDTYHRLRYLLYGKDKDLLLMQLLEKIQPKEEFPFYVS